MVLFSYFLLVTAVLGIAGVFVSIKYLKSSKTRNISIGATILSLLGYGIVLSFSDIAKPMSITGVQDEYTTDASGRTTIDGNYKRVPDYKQLSITVTEKDKELPEERAVVTISPSTDSFRIAYIMPESQDTSELKIVFDGESTRLTKTIKIVREDENKYSSSSEWISESASSVSSSSNSIDSTEEVTTTSSTITATSTDSSSTSYETFNAIKSDTIDRFNLEVEPEKTNKLKTIEIDSNREWIVATIANSISDYTKEQKEEIQKELGKRLIGLYRGAVMNGEDNSDLPIKVVYEDGTIFAESNKDDPMKLKSE